MLHSARLISIAKSVAEELRHLEPEALLAYIARVSNPDNQLNGNFKGLLQYCAKHGHWSVFESVNLTVEIETTKDVSAQILRHRSFCFQEQSLRYTSLDKQENQDFPYENPTFRLQDPKNRQKSIYVEEGYILGNLSSDDFDRICELGDRASSLLDDIFEVYEELISLNVARETARRILPVSHFTRLYMTGNLRSFIFYIKTRNSTDGKAQKEHQLVADSVEEIIRANFPITYEALF